MNTFTPEEVAIKLAILEDRQSRSDAASVAMLADLRVELRSISKDLAALNDNHHKDIEQLHDRISAEKKAAHDDIWDAFHRHEARAEHVIQTSTVRWDSFGREIDKKIEANRNAIDQGRLMTISSLTAAVIALAASIASAGLHLAGK